MISTRIDRAASEFSTNSHSAEGNSTTAGQTIPSLASGLRPSAPQRSRGHVASATCDDDTPRAARPRQGADAQSVFLPAGSLHGGRPGGPHRDAATLGREVVQASRHAHGPPTNWGELVQVHDDRDTIQASPDEMPAIDIHCEAGGTLTGFKNVNGYPTPAVR